MVARLDKMIAKPGGYYNVINISILPSDSDPLEKSYYN